MGSAAQAAARDGTQMPVSNVEVTTTTFTPTSLVQGNVVGTEPVPIDLTTEASPPRVSVAKAVAYVNNLGDNDVRNVLLEIVKSHSEARATVKAFCKRAVGSEERPFDFASLLEQCEEAADTVGGSAWDEAANDRDAMDDQCMLWDEATEPIVDAIQQIGILCQRVTTSTRTKLQAIATLLDIADLVNETSGWDEGQFQNFDKPDFEFRACAAIINAINTIETRSVYSTPAFRALLERFRQYEDLASVAKEIKGEMGEDLESGTAQ